MREGIKTTTIVLHFAHQLGAKPLFPLVNTTQILEKIMLQDTRDTHQRVRVNPATRINLVDVITVAVQLLRQPGNFDSLPQDNLPYHFSNMWILFLHGYKKIVSLICTARRSGHLYHKQ